MKKFYDLNLQVSLESFELVEKMVKKALELGFSGIGIPLSPNVSNETISRIRKICSDVGIDFVTRVNFVPKNPDELLSQLRRFRRKFELIAITCLSKPVARQAAKDRRVDLLLFPSIDFRKHFFDAAEAELAANALASLEIDMASIISATSFERIRLLSNIRKEIATAAKFSVPVVISSGANSELYMRKPRDLAALACLFDMPLTAALNALSVTPLMIVERNRAKLDLNYVAPGVRIIRRGKDCED